MLLFDIIVSCNNTQWRFMSSIERPIHLSKLYDAMPAMQSWIEENKPTPEQSEDVYKSFIGRYSITGTEEFISTTQKVIKEASQLASGITIMRRLLESGREGMAIIEGNDSHFEWNKNEENGSESTNITLNFSKPHQYVCLNEQNERDLKFHTPVSTFIHESLHAWHQSTDGDKPKDKDEALLLPDMDVYNEERVITGNLHRTDALDADFCCENTALLELGQPLRINHRGIAVGEETLHRLVQNRIFKNLRELIATHQIHNDKVNGLTALEDAMHLQLIERQTPSQEEWLKMISMLISAGIYSEEAFRLAILQNSKELIELMLKAGFVVTDELLQQATLEADERFSIIWQQLTASKTVISEEQIQKTAAPHYALKPGQEHPAIAMMEKQKKQAAAVKSKIVDDGSLPIHTIQRLFFSNFSNEFKNKEFFIDWVESHTFRKRHPPSQPKPSPTKEPTSSPVSLSSSKPVEAMPEAIETHPICATTGPQYSGAFVLTPQGTCILSTEFATSEFYPKCYKGHSYEIKAGMTIFPPDRYFSLDERDSFLRTLRSEDIHRLAEELTSLTIESLGIQNPTKELLTILNTRIEEAIHAAFSNTSSLKEKIEFCDPVHYLDINLLSTEGTGILNGVLETPTNKEGLPIQSSTCRLMLKQHLSMSYFDMHFAGEVLAEGEVVSKAAKSRSFSWN